MGFEPTVAINYDSFQDCSVRPLRHASVHSSLEEKLRPVEWRKLAAELAGFVCKQDAFEGGKHLGNSVILDRCRHSGCRFFDLIWALAHGKS
ncbi:MAG: hypothetical protein RJA66_5 [Actinomycetota bacterium]